MGVCFHSCPRNLISVLLMSSYTLLTKSPGRFLPPLMPLLDERNCTLLIFCLTFGLCRFVVSMMTENAKTNAASSSAKGQHFLSSQQPSQTSHRPLVLSSV